MSDLFIGIDIGTQGTKGVLCNCDGTVLFESFCSSKLIRPDELSVYENAEDILSASVFVIKEITSYLGENSKRIKAIGIDAQMAGIMGIDKDYKPVIPLDSWLDTRCNIYTELLEKEAGCEAIKKSGGQFIHAHASKILWWKNEQPQVYEKIAKFIQPNAYVAGTLCKLSAEQAFMDYTFLHFNLFSDNENCTFNEEMLSFFQVARKKMPNIVSPETVVGTVCSEWCNQLQLPENVQMIAGCGDTAASSLGAGVTQKGIAYDVAGTASVFACCVDRFMPDVSHRTLLFSRSVKKDLYLPLSYITGGGLCLEWLSKITNTSLKELDKKTDVAFCEDTPLFLPHFSGRTFPLDNTVSGSFVNLKHHTTKYDLHKAIMESIAFEYKNYFDILCHKGCIDHNTTVIGVGGGAKSKIFSQIKANVLGLRYSIPSKVDSAPVAVALLSACAIGYNNKTINEIFYPEISDSLVYVPDLKDAENYSKKTLKYKKLLDNYHNCV